MPWLRLTAGLALCGITIAVVSAPSAWAQKFDYYVMQADADVEPKGSDGRAKPNLVPRRGRGTEPSAAEAQSTRIRPAVDAGAPVMAADAMTPTPGKTSDIQAPRKVEKFDRSKPQPRPAEPKP